MHSKGVGSGYYHTYVQAQKLQKKNPITLSNALQKM